MPDEFILTNGINYIKEIDNQIGVIIMVRRSRQSGVA